MASEDTYYAMKLGPVASTTFDILKKKLDGDYLSDIEEISENEVLVKKQDEDELSESFKESLAFAFREFGFYEWLVLSEISHCYPEWKKHEAKLESSRRIFMDDRDFFNDPEDESCLAKFGKKADPFKEDQKFLELMKEDFDANFVPA